MYCGAMCNTYVWGHLRRNAGAIYRKIAQSVQSGIIARGSYFEESMYILMYVYLMF